MTATVQPGETLAELLTPEQREELRRKWEARIEAERRQREEAESGRPVVVERPRPKLSMAEFVRGGWHIVEPGTRLAWNWHIDAICEHLEAVEREEIRRLIINIPPGHMKSLLTSVFWPAWIWTFRPEWRGVFASYAQELAVRDSVRCRDLIRSDWYRGTFRPPWRLKGDQDVKSHFENTRGGFRYSTSVGGQGTGWRGDCILVDDPLNARDQWSEAARKEAIRWWDQVMASRLNDQRRGARVIMMQRLHEEDLSGHCLAKGGYDHLCLPSEFEPARRCSTSIGWTDPREEDGELLFPELFPPSVLAELKSDLGMSGFSGQYQQAPAPDEGDIFKKHWWRFWHIPGQPLPPVVVKRADSSLSYCPVEPLPTLWEEELQSWDLAFKETKTSDFICGQLWRRAGANRYLLDQVLRRADFPTTLREILAFTERHPGAGRKLIEDAANGPAVIATLHQRIGGLIAVAPYASKVARAQAVTPQIESGNVYLPHPLLAPWVQPLIDKCAAFPHVAHDDEVDALTQALNHWTAIRKASKTPGVNTVALSRGTIATPARIGTAPLPRIGRLPRRIPGL